jgi:tetratricopeptide (TPR) repeat protein
MQSNLDQTDAAILNEYPLPLAISYQHALSEQNSLNKPRAIVEAFEALLKYCAIIALQDSYRAGLNPPRFSPATIEQLLNIKAGGAWKILRDTLLLFRHGSNLVIDPDLYFFVYDAFQERPGQRLETWEYAQTLLSLAQKYQTRGGNAPNDNECETDYYTYLPVLRSLYKRAAFVTRLPLLYFHDPVDAAAAIDQATEEALAVAEPMMGLHAIAQALAARRLPGAPFGHLAIKAQRSSAMLNMHPLLMMVETIEMVAANDEGLAIGPHLIIFFDEIRGSDQDKVLRYWQLNLPALPRGNEPKLTIQSGIFNQLFDLIKNARSARKTRAKLAQQVQKLIEQRNLGSAIQEFKKISEAEPDNFAIAARLGELYFHAGMRKEAVETFQLLAERCMDDGLVPQAMLMYQRVSRLSPDNINAGLKLANICSDQGCLSLAVQQCERVIEYSAQTNLIGGALKALELAVSLQPRNANMQRRLGEIYKSENKRAAALKCLLVAGEELLSQGQPQVAREVYESILEIKPYHPTAMAALSHMYLDQGENDKAIDMLVPLCQSDPANVELLGSLARAYLNSNQLEAAEETYSTLYALDKTCYENLLELGRRFLFRGDLDRVGLIIERCQYTLMARGKERQAAGLLESCLANNPYHLPSLKRLIDIFLMVRDNNNLRRALRRMAAAAKHEGDLVEAKTALRQLAKLEPENGEYLKQLREMENEG